MEKIYLDHGATTPMHSTVIDEMTQVMKDVYGNPSSIHQFGREASSRLEKSREVVANSIQAKDHEIVFTSGGTESDNTAIITTAFSRQNEGRHIITTMVEHPAVLKTMNYLEENGFEVTYLSVNEQGTFSMAEFKEALREDTILVSIMYTNNETGVKFPIEEIGNLLENHPAYFHTDAVQAFSLEEIDVHKEKIDLLSASAHKINGPKGIGFLYLRDTLPFSPFIHGGDQEEKRRGGTENLAAICGFAKAIELNSLEKKKEKKLRYQGFTKDILAALNESKIDYKVNGQISNQTPHILNLWIQGIPNDLLLMQLDLKGIAISIGSACTAGNVEPSHVLEGMRGDNHISLKESIRISYGLGITKEDIQTFIKELICIIERMKSKRD